MKPLDVIPHHPYYCYSGSLGSGLCPYWKKTETGARCEYLEVDSVEGDWDNLIWDQIKQCGVNDEGKRNLEWAVKQFPSVTPDEIRKQYEEQKEIKLASGLTPEAIKVFKLGKVQQAEQNKVD